MSTTHIPRRTGRYLAEELDVVCLYCGQVLFQFPADDGWLYWEDGSPEGDPRDCPDKEPLLLGPRADERHEPVLRAQVPS
jgi:hypothetical protein